MYTELIEALLKEANEYFNAAENRECSCKCKKGEEKNESECKSYFHSVCDKFEDGERVDHREKIVKDGKVLKDIHTGIEDKKEEKKSIEGNKANEIEKLNAQVNELKNEIVNLRANFKEVREQLAKAERQNKELKNKFTSIQNVLMN